MKIKIRKNVFETNSSSTHSMCITNNVNYEHPTYVLFQFGDFGWEYNILKNPFNKASYLFTLAASLKLDDDFVEVVSEWLSEDNIEYDFQCSYFLDSSGNQLINGYVDHSNEAYDFYEYVLSDKEIFYKFLFSDESFIITGNDNAGHNVDINVEYDHKEFYKGN